MHLFLLPLSFCFLGTYIFFFLIFMKDLMSYRQFKRKTCVCVDYKQKAQESSDHSADERKNFGYFLNLSVNITRHLIFCYIDNTVWWSLANGIVTHNWTDVYWVEDIGFEALKRYYWLVCAYGSLFQLKSGHHSDFFSED